MNDPTTSPTAGKQRQLLLCELNDPFYRSDGVPFAPGSTRSRAAARRVRERRAGLLDRIMDAMRAAGGDGLTDFEIQGRTGIPANSERPRRLEGQRRGLIVATNRTRPSPTGAACTVYTLAEVARGR